MWSACEGACFLFQQRYAHNVSIILLLQSSRQYLFGFFFLAILFLSPCIKKYSSPLISSRFRFSYFQELSRAYQVVKARILNDVPTAASPCSPLPSSLPHLSHFISFLRSCAALPTSWGCPPALSWQGLQGARSHLVVMGGKMKLTGLWRPGVSWRL